MSFLKNRRILVTGCCGTVGRELVRQLLADHAPAELVGLDNNESDLFFMEQHFGNHGQGKFFLGDVRDPDKLFRKMEGIDVVFHAAAFKHVICASAPPSRRCRPTSSASRT